MTIRASDIIIVVCLLIIWQLARRTETGAGIVPPDDDTPRTQTTPKAPALYEVDLSKSMPIGA